MRDQSPRCPRCSDTLVALLFPEYVQHPPALGPLHLLFLLPRKQNLPPSGSAQIAPSTAYLECLLKLCSTDGKQQKAVQGVRIPRLCRLTGPAVTPPALDTQSERPSVAKRLLGAQRGRNASPPCAAVPRQLAAVTARPLGTRSKSRTPPSTFWAPRGPAPTLRTRSPL